MILCIKTLMIISLITTSFVVFANKPRISRAAFVGFNPNTVTLSNRVGKLTNRMLDERIKTRLFVSSREKQDDIFEAEEAAAYDAHDVSDAGFEAAAMERAVMMAEEFKHDRESKKRAPEAKKEAVDVMETADLSSREKQDDILEAEEAAAYDAHDVSDAGFEAAAMERAVMMAEEFKHDRESKKRAPEAKKEAVDIMETADVMETAALSSREKQDDIFEAEEAAAYDAHDVSDAGFEAAAMERAVMMAEEFKQDRESKKRASQAKEKAVTIMETAAMDLEKVIETALINKKENEEWAKVLSQADSSDLAILILEKATKAAAVDAIAKAEKLAEKSSAEAHEAIEEQKLAFARAADAASEAANALKAITVEHDYDEDVERRRKMSVVHSVEHVAEDSVAAIRDAEEKERKAKQDKAAAQAWIDTIKEKEDQLKADLEMFEAEKAEKKRSQEKSAEK